jgi:hypothetical protein
MSLGYSHVGGNDMKCVYGRSRGISSVGRGRMSGREDGRGMNDNHIPLGMGGE